MADAERLFQPRFFVMCGFTFTVFLSAFLLFPTAPFRVLALGGSEATAGLFLGFLTYASALSAPFTGALADRLGTRRMLVGCGAAAARKQRRAASDLVFIRASSGKRWASRKAGL